MPACFENASQQNSEWSEIKSFRPFKLEQVRPLDEECVPGKRSGQRMVCDEGNLYMFGGFNPLAPHLDYGLFAELWRFNIATRTWKLLVDKDECPKRETASHTMNIIGSSLIIFGGTGFRVPFKLHNSNGMFVYNVSTKKWSQFYGVKGNQPCARYGHSEVIYNGNLYIIGGTDSSEYLSDVWSLNLKTYEWTLLLPSGVFRAVYRHEVCAHNNRIFVIGGGTHTQTYKLQSISALDLPTNQWINIETIPDREMGYPAARKFHSMGCFKNYAVLVGGYSDHTAYSDIWLLNLDTFQWSKMKESLPEGLFFSSVAVSKAGCMYLFGGVHCQLKNRRSNTLYRMWLTLPPLQELLWQIVCDNYSKEFLRSDFDDLRRVWRLPPNFVSRVCWLDEESKEEKNIGKARLSVTSASSFFGTWRTRIIDWIY